MCLCLSGSVCVSVSVCGCSGEGGLTCRMPLGTLSTADSLVLVCVPFEICNKAGSEAQDIVTVDSQVHLLAALRASPPSAASAPRRGEAEATDKGAEPGAGRKGPPGAHAGPRAWPQMWGLAVEEIWGLAGGVCVIRQLLLDRLDSSVPRIKTSVMLVPREARLRHVQLALLYRTFRWNAAQVASHLRLATRACLLLPRQRGAVAIALSAQYFERRYPAGGAGPSSPLDPRPRQP
jgi:hypothetical protein